MYGRCTRLEYKEGIQIEGFDPCDQVRPADWLGVARRARLRAPCEGDPQEIDEMTIMRLQTLQRWGYSMSKKVLGDLDNTYISKFLDVIERVIEGGAPKDA
jgi:hypothetical protein